jgi:hypothetical protein
MIHTNALVTGVWRGLLRPGAGQRAYLNCLALQAVAIVLWWPKANLSQALAHEQGPQPLLAVTVAISLTIAYYSIRAGAEEFLLDGQQPLREWAVGTSLSIRQILTGGVFGHGLQTLHQLALSSPLLCLAYTVGGGDGASLAACLLMVVLQAEVFWLTGAIVYLLIGHSGQSTYVTLRVIVAATYLGSAVAMPSASHFRMSVHLLGGSSEGELSSTLLTPPLVFLLTHAVLIALLCLVLAALLLRYRRNIAIADTPPIKTDR